MQKIYKERYFLSAGEANAEQEMQLPLLIAKFIDIATAHANSLHLGNPDMAQHNAGWVLSRMALEMKSYPKVNCDYTISTWVESWTRRFSVRCFKVEDEAGNAIGYSRSIWMILSTDTHESLPLTILSPPGDIEIKDDCPIEKSAKHRVILPFGTNTDTTDQLEASSPSAFHRFKYCDLDFYRHVNTVRYFTLLLNQFSLTEMDESFVSRIEMSFLSEGAYGEDVEIRRNDAGLTTSFYLSGHEERPILYSRIIRSIR